MPIGPFPDFDACVAHMMKPKKEGGGGYDEETARKVCGKLKAELEESFNWASSLEVLKPYRQLIHGKAIHPIKTFHPYEWPQLRVYLEEELKKSAETLIGKPLFLDHARPLNGSVLGAHYEDGALEYIARVEDEDVLRMIRNGQIKHASVQFEWKILEQVDGVAPRGLNFQHLSLLKDMQPGDPRSTVQLFESIARQLKEAMDRRRKEATEAKNATSTPKDHRSKEAKGLTPPNPAQGSETEKEEMGERVLLERIWDSAYINDLDDDCFAYIESGGEKDEQGKTTPRSLRHLPFKNRQGNIDLPHLRNALARLPQTKFSDEAKAEAKRKLCAAAKKVGLKSEVCGLEEQVAPIPEEIGISGRDVPEWMDDFISSVEDAFETINENFDAVTSRLEALEKTQKPEAPREAQEAQKTVEALKAQIQVLESQKATLQEEVKGVKKPGEAIISSNVTPPRAMIPKKAIEAVLPPDWIARAWGLGPQRLVQDIKRVLRQSWEA